MIEEVGVMLVEYSPIKNWRVKNFRNIGDVNIDFTKSPIIALVGDNEAGKTSIVKTFEVVGYNGNSKGQKEYIRDNTNGFGIASNLVDGTSVVRMKSTALNMFQVDVPGKTRFQTNKLDSNEVPPEVQQVMGMVIESETKEPLHVRTYENQLLFVLTKSSENYKVMYNALKVDNLTRAIKDGSSEVNELKSSIRSNEIGIDTLTNNIKAINILDIEPAVNIKDRLSAEITQLEKLETVMKILQRNRELNDQLGTLRELQQVEEISLSEVSKLIQFNVIKNRLIGLINSKEMYSKIQAMDEIDLTETRKLKTVLGYINKNSGLVKQNSKYSELSKTNPIEVEVITRLNRCVDLINRNTDIKKENLRYDVHSIESIGEEELHRQNSLLRIADLLKTNEQKRMDVQTCKEKVDELSNQIKQMGVLVGTCPNCGETVVMEV